jgi:hypothetical protein
MATALQFRTEAAANSILKADRAKTKLDWAILDIDTCPADIAALANDMAQSDLAYRQAKAALEAALSDKAIVPTGKRLIVTTGRSTNPSALAPILFALADGTTTKSTKIVSFDQFIKA